MNGNNKYTLKYLLWLLDMAVIVLSFTAATYIRWQNFRDMYSKQLHFLVCLILLLIATVYSFGIDYNRDYM